MHYQSQYWISLFLVDLVTYITRFQWDMAKYPIKQSLKNISEIIAKVKIAFNIVFSSLMKLTVLLYTAEILTYEVIKGGLFYS